MVRACRPLPLWPRPSPSLRPDNLITPPVAHRRLSLSQSVDERHHVAVGWSGLRVDPDHLFTRRFRPSSRMALTQCYDPARPGTLSSRLGLPEVPDLETVAGAQRRRRRVNQLPDKHRQNHRQTVQSQNTSGHLPPPPHSSLFLWSLPALFPFPRRGSKPHFSNMTTKMRFRSETSEPFSWRKRADCPKAWALLDDPPASYSAEDAARLKLLPAAPVALATSLRSLWPKTRSFPSRPTRPQDRRVSSRNVGRRPHPRSIVSWTASAPLATLKKKDGGGRDSSTAHCEGLATSTLRTMPSDHGPGECASPVRQASKGCVWPEQREAQQGDPWGRGLLGGPSQKDELRPKPPTVQWTRRHSTFNDGTVCGSHRATQAFPHRHEEKSGRLWPPTEPLQVLPPFIQQRPQRGGGSTRQMLRTSGRRLSPPRLLTPQTPGKA